jgi:hypothetical protein
MTEKLVVSLQRATSLSTSARIPLQPYLGGKVPGLLSMLPGGVVMGEYLVHRVIKRYHGSKNVRPAWKFGISWQ